MIDNDESPLREILGSNRSIGLVLLLVAASLFPTWAPDRSRPEVQVLPFDPVADTESGESVRARLWEDPLAAAYRDATSAKSSKSGPAEVHRMLDRRMRAEHGSLTLLPVVVAGGSSPNSRENRLRYRYAVVSALGRAGYAPRDGQRIGYFYASGADDHASEDRWFERGVLEAALRAPSMARGVVPFESFEPRVPGGDTLGVLVLWIDEDFLGDRPARKLLGVPHAILGHECHPDGCIATRSQVRVVWTTGSSALIALLEDWGRGIADGDLPADMPAGAIYASSATIHDEFLMGSLSEPAAEHVRARGATAEPFPWAVSTCDLKGLERDWTLHRTIGDDLSLATALLEEVGRRVAGPPRIALFAEWDTHYGRAWKRTFKEALERLARAGWTEPDTYTYLAGIDGRVPGLESASTTPGTPQTPEEFVAEGTERADYIRRLLDRVDSVRSRFAADGRRDGYDAIGVLGSDVHDKLFLLSILRREFPGAVFFTSDLDARFLDPRGVHYLSNLVVASHYGLDLDPELHDAIPPFRDSYQSSLFHATLLALDDPLARKFRCGDRPHVYEVGRGGLFDLSPLDLPANDPTPVADGDPLRRIGLGSLGTILGIVAAALVAALLLGSILRSARPRASEKHAGGRQWAWTGLSLALFLGLFAAFYLSQRGTAGREPFALFSGVSSWPSELLRLLAAALALGWQYRVMADLRGEVPRVQKELGVRLQDAVDMSSTDLRLDVVRSPDKGTEWSARYLGPPGIPPRLARLGARIGLPWAWPSSRGRTAVEIFDHFQVWALDKYRARRTLVHLVLFMLFGWIVIRGLAGMPPRPIRGDAARAFDVLALVIAVLSMQWLVFLVLDSAMIVSRFIRNLSREDIVDPRRPHYAGVPKEKLLKDEYLWAKRRMQVTARLTDVVGRSLYYPSFVILLMVCSRLPVFDNWTWPTGLVVVVSASIVILGVCYLLMWAAARSMRRDVLAALRQERGETFGGDDATTKAIDRYIDEVRALRTGAFAPIAELPLLRAALIPFAGVGGLSLLDGFRF